METVNVILKVVTLVIFFGYSAIFYHSFKQKIIDKTLIFSGLTIVLALLSAWLN